MITDVGRERHKSRRDDERQEGKGWHGPLGAKGTIGGEERIWIDVEGETEWEKNQLDICPKENGEVRLSHLEFFTSNAIPTFI